jgi:hypothetical protein
LTLSLTRLGKLPQIRNPVPEKATTTFFMQQPPNTPLHPFNTASPPPVCSPISPEAPALCIINIEPRNQPLQQGSNPGRKMSTPAPTSRSREAPQGDEEAAAELKLGEFQDVDALTHSEAALVINALVQKRTMDRKNMNETE